MNNNRDAWTDFLCKKIAGGKPFKSSTVQKFNAGSDVEQLNLEPLNARDPHARLVVAELKKMGEDPTPKQWEWLYLFQACGAEIFVWRPLDFDEMTQVLL